MPHLRSVLSLLIALWLPIPALAADAPSPLRPALWKVSDGDTTIWMFGTVHMLPPGTVWLTGPVAQAADSADEITTEILDPGGTATRAAVAAHALLPAGSSLAAGLPAATRSAMDQRLATLGLTPMQFDRFKPWYAAVALSSLPLLRRGFDPANGVEAALEAREAQRGVRRSAIETPESQLGVFDTLPVASQNAYLTEVLTDFDKIEPDIDAMFRAWGKGDAEELARLMNEDSAKDDPLLTQRLILDRNAALARWIKARLDRPGRVLVAVGAGHLAGPGSVQEDLAAMGLHVERVQ